MVELHFGEPRVVPAGWPPDVAPRDLITAAHINTIKSSVYQWPGHVNAGGFQLQNCQFDSASKTAMQTPWIQNIDAAGFQVFNLGAAPGAGIGNEAIALQAGRLMGANAVLLETLAQRVSSGTSHDAFEHRIRRKVDVTSMGYIAFGSNYIAMGSATSETMRITSGNVGIGTAIPGVPLEIAGSAEILLKLNSAASDAAMQLANTGSGGHTYRIDSTSGGSGYGSGALVIVDEAANYPPRLIINSLGSIGIGTANPTAKFHVRVASDVNLKIETTGADAVLTAINNADNVFLPMKFIALNYVLPLLPSSNPGAGTKQLWYDPSDSNRVKFAA